MEFITSVLAFLIILTVLVFVHEMGHLLVARRNQEMAHLVPLNGLDDVWQMDNEARRIAIDLFDSSL